MSGLIYFAFMAAWLNLFLLIGLSHAAASSSYWEALAMGIGLVNVKDFFAFRRGFSLRAFRTPPSLEALCEDPPDRPGGVSSRRPGRRDRAGGLGQLLVELLCTGRIPRPLHPGVEHLPSASLALLCLGLYNLAYIADDALMVTLAVVTLSAWVDEREGR
ncbi:MAG: hypothetical protein MRJ92_01540 [Nitrospira sp.]|nr:hypothetical protein [Nitrospira sp.]